MHNNLKIPVYTKILFSCAKNLTILKESCFLMLMLCCCRFVTMKYFKKLLLFSTIFFETNIMSDLSWTLCEQMELAYGLAKVSIE
jgi:hypothetical protein